MAAIAVYGTLHNEGPFWNYPPNTSLLYLQSYMVLVAVGAMSFAASQFERKAFADSLEYKVRERTEELTLAVERERAKQEQLRNVIARFDVATIAADEHMNILHANKQFHSLFPNTHDDSSPRTILKLFTDISDAFKEPEQTLDELRRLLGERRRIENHRCVLKNGTYIFCDYNPIIDDRSHRGHLLLFRTA